MKFANQKQRCEESSIGNPGSLALPRYTPVALVTGTLPVHVSGRSRVAEGLPQPAICRQRPVVAGIWRIRCRESQRIPDTASPLYSVRSRIIDIRDPLLFRRPNRAISGKSHFVTKSDVERRAAKMKAQELARGVLPSRPIRGLPGAVAPRACQFAPRTRPLLVIWRPSVIRQFTTASDDGVTRRRYGEYIGHFQSVASLGLWYQKQTRNS